MSLESPEVGRSVENPGGKTFVFLVFLYLVDANLFSTFSYFICLHEYDLKRALASFFRNQTIDTWNTDDSDEYEITSLYSLEVGPFCF
jgi:hypothetical protein